VYDAALDQDADCARHKEGKRKRNGERIVEPARVVRTDELLNDKDEVVVGDNVFVFENKERSFTMSALSSLSKIAVSLAIFALVTLASATLTRADTVTFDLNRGSTLPNQNYGTVTLTLNGSGGTIKLLPGCLLKVLTAASISLGAPTGRATRSIPIARRVASISRRKS